MAVRSDQSECQMVSLPCSTSKGACFLPDEFKALFELIPKPVTVEIPITLAKALRDDANRIGRLRQEDSDTLERLIAAAEKEAK